MQAQTIQIDSTFTSDGEIFPFGPNDTIYGLSISGHVTLSSDTSLVRVILTDNSGNEWMVYEAYPMIVTDSAFDLEDVCDESCYLEEFHPHSLIIQIIDAEISISELSCSTTRYENLSELHLQAKRTKDLEKVQLMNQYIVSKGWEWVADTTGFVKMFLQEKAQFFHYKYNLLGLDYYSGGVYYSAAYDCIVPYTESTIVSSFDWRKKHNANLSSSMYWDHNPDQDEVGNGWMTGIKLQECGSCQSFATISSLEAAINLYANYQFDYAQEIRFSARDAFNCSTYKDGIGCTCDTHQVLIGKGISAIMLKLKNEGGVSEECYPWPDDVHPDFCEANGNYYQDCSFSSKCENPNMTAYICAEKIFDLSGKTGQSARAAYLKELLIDNGPLTISLHNWPNDASADHAVSLVGFDTDQNGNIIWIFKNSWGLETRWGESGYGRQSFWLGSYNYPCSDPMIMNSIYAFNYDDTCSPPITIIADPVFDLTVQDIDNDHDGFYNWGIGHRINDHPCDIEDEDSNDDDNRIGPYQDDYSGKPVTPKMIVTAGLLNTPITNHGFYFMENLDPQNIDIIISNPGTAQLNLAYIMPVTIIDDGSREFSLSGNQPESKICLNNASSFQVQFAPDPLEVNHSAVVKIQLHQCDSDIYEYFEFQILYGECDFNSEIYWVTGYESWVGYSVMNQNVYIAEGATLEIHGSVAMNEESDIIVKAGGKLIVNGGLITGSCNTLWHGIDIWGNSNQPQTLEFQGMVSLMNQGCIEYAETAIETVICPGCERPFPTGGIVSCSDAVFKDNLMDVKFYPYNNTHPVTHQLVHNISSFTKTIFETTEDLFKFNFGMPSSHIFMNQVGGIRYEACSFGNYSAFHAGSRGIGIESYGAGYFVTNGCARQDVYPCPSILPCHFENLDYGIRAFNNYGLYNISVGSAEFKHNRRGIYLGLVNNATVIRNTFDISDPEHLWPQESLVGLYLDEFTTGFVVEENTFYGPSTFSSSVGIHLLNTGTDQNEIYNNSFTTLYHGIAAVGINRLSDKEIEGVGLCIKCNDFQQCNNDVYVTYETDELGNPIYTENTGIAQKQGDMNESGNSDNTLAAGNTFSNVTSSNYFNDRHCGRIDYTYHGHNNSEKKIIPGHILGDIYPGSDYDATYTKIGSCPSHLGGGITPSIEKSILVAETNLISAYEDTLLIVTDGGNTEGLNLDVLTSYPEEALAIRQNLMEESPYLSDTVMISAIEKEDVLPGVMIRDILVQNPQAPKSEKILNAINDRQDTIPDYMMEEIMQGLNTYGAKELLEQKLGEHVAKRDRAWNSINLYYKNDTANVGLSFDSLISLYQDENRLSAKYKLAFMYLDQDDSLNAFGVLDNIPTEFYLSVQELSTHNHYQDLFDILWSVKSDTTGLDSLQIQSLFDLFYDDQAIPGYYAANLLIKERSLFYNEPVYLYDPLKSVPAPDKKHEIESEVEHLKIFPNPAGNYFITQYDFTGQQNPGIITISDSGGKELWSIHLKDKQNQIVIPVENLAPGTYLIKLCCGKGLLDSAKLIITK